MARDDARLDELEDQWLAAAQSGRSLLVVDLCADRPDLIEALEKRLTVLRRFRHFADADVNSANDARRSGIDDPARPGDLAEANNLLGAYNREPLAPDRDIQTGSFDHIVSACAAFADDWSADARPSIQNRVAGVATEARPALLRNLLAIELDRRRAKGEHPRLDDYLRLFPEFTPLVREVFVDNSSLSVAVGETDGGSPPVVAAPIASRLGNYRLLRVLGRGGMGVVYEAVHLERGTRVALKTLPAVDGTALHRFKREFRALVDVNHSNLIGLHSLEADGNHWFFTMDLIEGVDFLEYVRPAGILQEVRLRAALSQLATGVMALHARHVIHRDLKPPNVIVSNEGRVVLLDFGLVAELNGTDRSRSLDRISGTPRYMAPEQAAGREITTATDWYAVGVMLYEALSGKSPFNGPLWQILQDKQTRDAVPLRASSSIPADLADLTMRLLARDPGRRPDALEIAEAVSSADSGVLSAIEGTHRQLVGRDQQMTALQDVRRTFEREREPVTVFISGRSGEGKTALAEHFLSTLRDDSRLAVMAGRCYDRESVPFKALDTLIDALSTFLRQLPGEDAALLMPDDIGLLAQVFPVLQRVEVVFRATDPRLSALDEHQVRQRAFRALRSLLGRISRRTPIIWLVDDLQWGDADSAEALFEVLRPPEAPAVLFLGTYRSDEAQDSVFLAKWKDLQRIHAVQFSDREIRVGPLTETECVDLVVGILGLDTEVIRRRAETFAQETRGNPFLLIELVGCFDPETDSFEPMPLHEVLTRKLGRLPAEAGDFLDVVSVSGQALTAEEAARTAGHAVLPTATISRMRNERLIRLIGSDDDALIDTYHDRVRETILSRMDESKCKMLHRQLAEVIETEVGGPPADLVVALEGGEAVQAKAIPRVYDLAYHFDAAGERRKAWIYAFLAAEQARRQSALEVAVNNYSLAKRNAQGTSNAVSFRMAEGCGEALMLLGRYKEADEQLHGLSDRVEDLETKAQIEGLRGEIAFKQGLIDKSVGHFEEGLRGLGNWVPRSLFGLGFGILRETIVQCWHAIWPGRLHRKPANKGVDLTVRLLNRLGLSALFQSSPRMLWAHLSGINRAESVPPSRGLVLSYSEHSCWSSMLGWANRGARYGERASVLAREFDDLWAQANSCNYTGIGLYAAARYEAGLSRIGDAIAGFEKCGDLWELHLAHFHKGCCHFGLGNLTDAVAEARWTFSSSSRLGDSRTMCSSWLWARATRGNIPFDRIRSCLPDRPDDVMSTVHSVLAEGYWHSYHARTKEALQSYERAARMVWNSRCVNSHTILALPMLVSGLRLRADSVEIDDPLQARKLRRRARRRARLATRLTRFFPAAYPLALRERSLILAACGRTKKALKLAKKSCTVAEAQKARYEYAQSLLVCGRLGEELGLPGADEQILTAQTEIGIIEAPIVNAQLPS
jgi:tetratricopeptide (TPR) repeat protein